MTSNQLFTPSVRMRSAVRAGPECLLGRIGTLEARLARNPAEVRAAQQLRHRVFFGGDGADIDRYDAFCEHLLVIDRALPGPERDRIVGTYRLLRQDRAAAAGGFYTSAEFDLDRLVARHPERTFLELGRSCVLPAWRSRRTIELLWQGIWAYCRRHDIDVMTGCASFPGTVPAAHAEALSFLHHQCRATGEWSAAALPGRRSSMDLMPAEAVDAKAALAALPPLIKGYLRVGAVIGDGCVVDHDFGSVDVLVIMPVERIAGRYIAHYGTEAERYAA